MNFGSVLTAMVTPFNEEGKIDFPKTTALIEHLIANGSDGLVVAGTTGESPTLSSQEKLALFDHVVRIVDHRVPVIAGTGNNNTAASISLTKEAESLGVDGILLVTPYYNKPNQSGLYEHFATIAKSTMLPIMLYNIPGRSVISLHVDTIIKLSQIPNVVSIKDSSGNLDLITTIIDKTSEEFTVYSGDDSLGLPIMAVGGTGIVSVASHIVGNEIKMMLTSYQQGNVEESGRIHRNLLPLMKGLFIAPSPAPVKAVLNFKGIEVGSVRLPLVPLNDLELEQLKQLCEKI
ncbi:4-hydroxy-tetrahydrodipicolinate synthase [Radiobacillus sp. PE A8.2]|uniref:4-hydroxy-tetrahydrodipicolinate synthase n=1 Tax=Radiobacillus sp. PE A8.2 TaxID=3380349 RepID=UPI00388F22C0